MITHFKDPRRWGTNRTACGTLVRRTVAFSNLGIEDKTGASALLSIVRADVTCDECNAAMVAMRIVDGIGDDTGKPVLEPSVGLYNPINHTYGEWSLENFDEPEKLHYGDIIGNDIVVRARNT